MSDLPFLFLSPPDVGEEERAELLSAFDSNYIAPVGPHLTRFEEEFCEKTGFTHCVAVTSGTAAIHLGLRCLGVGSGDVVLASSLTFIGSVSPATFLGAELVFVDSDKSTWTMDTLRLRNAIESLQNEGKKIGAILPTDIYGQSCDLGEIVRIGNEFGIPVLCDSAEALGATFQGESVGRAARAAAFSFNGNKILTTSGGGILASDDDALVERARYLATQTREPVVHFEHLEVGYNYRMSNLLAGVGIAQLEKLGSKVEKRRWIFEQYRMRLEDLPGVTMMPEADYGVSNRWLTCLLIDLEELGVDREHLRLALMSENIESRPVWKPMHLQPCFQEIPCVGGEVAESLFNEGLCLPSGSQMEQADVERVCECLISAIS